MAVVGEAHIVVRAITTGVREEILRALNGASGDIEKTGEKLGKKLSAGINKNLAKTSFLKSIERDALKARAAFSSLQRTGITMQTIFGVLAGTIGSLGGAFGSLVGLIGAAAPSMVFFAGTMVSVKIAAGLAKLALGGVGAAMQKAATSGAYYGKTIAAIRNEMQQLKFAAEEAALAEQDAAIQLEKAREGLQRVQDLPPNNRARREAELAYSQADLAYRKAQDANKKAQKEAKQNKPTQTVDPYAGLTKSQIAFAKALGGLRPKFRELKEAVASGFLPTLQKSIQSVMKTSFPTLKKGFNEVGIALGKVSTSAGKAISDATKSGSLGNLFKTSAAVIVKLGSAISKVFGAVLKVLKVASPQTKKFAGFIDKLATRFKTFIDKTSKNGTMSKFFNDAAGFAKDFGVIFGNIWNGVFALVADAFKPGSGAHMLLDWLKNATTGFGNLGKDPKLHKYLQDTTANALAVLDVFGKVIGVLKNLGDDPNVKKFWDTVGKGTPDLEKILQDGVKAAPTFGELLLNIAGIISAFSDTGTLQTFWDILKNIAKTINDFVNIPGVKGFLATIGQWHGVFLALGLTMTLAKKAAMILVGTMLNIFAPFKSIHGFLIKNSKVYQGIVKKVISGYETIALKAMYAGDKARDFRKKLVDSMKDGIKNGINKMKDGWDTIRLKAMYAGDKVKDFGKKTVDAFKSGMDAASKYAKVVGGKVVAALKAAGTWIVDVSKKLAIQTLNILKNVAQWVAQKAALILAKGAMLLQAAATNIAAAAQTALDVALDANPIGLLIIAIAAVVAALVFFFTQTEVGRQAWQTFVDWLTSLWNGMVDFFTKLGPIMEAGWKGMISGITDLWNGFVGFFKGLGSVFSDIWNGIVSGIKNIWNGFVGFLQTAIGAVVSFVRDHWGLLLSIFTGPFGLVIQYIVDHWGTITKFFSDSFTNIGKWFGNTVGNFSQVFSNAVGGLGGIFKGAWGGVESFFKNFVNNLTGMFATFINFFVDGINGIIDGLNSLKVNIPSWVPVVGGQKWGINIGKVPKVSIPKLADGGVVMPKPGGTMVQVAEAGRPERVEPLDPNGLSNRDKKLIELLSAGNIGSSATNLVINVTATPGMDEKRLVDLISREIPKQLRKTI